MYVGRRYPLRQTLHWSRMDWLIPLGWSTWVTVLYQAGLQMLAIPWLPISLVGIAVAFYLGFKNGKSYERMWEARKIYGAIVNASRHWAYSVRDLPGATAEGGLDGIAERMVHRHVAWMDALRHQLRRLKSWEHQDRQAKRIKNFPFPRQYATVNTYFAWLFVLLIPMGMLTTFGELSSHYAVWLTIPFSTVVSWVFLSADRIGDWSENPFEGLAHDVPITSMSRGIERDIRQMLDEQELPEPRPLQGKISF